MSFHLGQYQKRELPFAYTHETHMCRSHIPSSTQTGQQMWKEGRDIRLFPSVNY